MHFTICTVGFAVKTAEEFFGLLQQAGRVLLPWEMTVDLPIVDRDWRGFIDRLIQRIEGANHLTRIKRFLNGSVKARLLDHPSRFLRLGLSRPYKERWWLMLDSLFPQPDEEWRADIC